MRTRLGFLGSALLLVACDGEAPAAGSSTSERSQAVLAAPGAPAAPSAATAAPSPAAPVAASARKGPLCASRPGGKLPARKLSGLGKRGSPFTGGKLTSGLPTWVNLWAAWCEPCKKELPLLAQFQKRLRADGVQLQLAFLSVDDDERQLQRFLDAPSAALESTFWLREGNERDDWLADLRLPAEPRLPVHLLVGADGEVFCRIDGSIESDDYEAAAKLLREHQ